MSDYEPGFYVPGTKGYWAVYPKYKDGHKGKVRREYNEEDAEQMARIVLNSDHDIKQVNIDWVIEE